MDSQLDQSALVASVASTLLNICKLRSDVIEWRSHSWLHYTDVAYGGSRAALVVFHFLCRWATEFFLSLCNNSLIHEFMSLYSHLWLLCGRRLRDVCRVSP